MEIQLNKPQSLAHRALRPGNSVCAPWGRGVGKSWYQRFLWWSSVAQWDGVARDCGLRPMSGVRIVHLMPTFKQCKDIHKDSTIEELGEQWSFLNPKIDRTTWRINFPGGSWLQWFGAREANSARGVRCDIVTVDEADDVDPSVLDSVIKPWFTEPWSMRTVLIGGTPRRGRYGLLYREHESGRRAADVRAGRVHVKPALEAFLRRKYSFHATYRDAPETVDAQFIEEQRAAHEDAGKLPIFKREYECDFDSAEGLVYPMFEPTFHVREPPQGVQWSEVLVGGDFGYEDPGVLLVIAVVGSGADAVLYVIGEIYQRQKTPTWWKEQAAEVVRRWPHAKWYCDTARPDMIADYKSVGAKVQQFDKAEIEGGAMAVADRLAVRHVGDDLNSRYARLYVSPRCRNTIEELGKYRRKRDPKNTDRFLDDIEDANNHACDSLRYSVVGRFGGVQRKVIEGGTGWGG